MQSRTVAVPPRRISTLLACDRTRVAFIHVAHDEIEFMVPKNVECVVVQIRTEGWLCVACDAGSHVLLPGYHIIKPTNQELTFQRFGYLSAALPLSNSTTNSPVKHAVSSDA